MKKLLLISYYWPPAGGPACQRILSFARYLPEYNWKVVVLTVSNGDYPVRDESLKNIIPPDCPVYKTITREPFSLYRKFLGLKKEEKIPVAVLAQQNCNWKKQFANWIRLNLFVPDARKGWIKHAVKKGKEIVEHEKPDLILSSSPPPSVHLIAEQLAEFAQVPWVTDFRDPWTRIHYYQKNRNSFTEFLDLQLEKRILRNCSGIVSASKGFAELLSIPSQKKYRVITNGYDEPDFPEEKKISPFFRIVHTGSLSPNRFDQKIFLILKELIDRKEIPSEKLEIILIGKIDENIHRKITAFLPVNIIKFKPFAAHNQALQVMQNAELLLLFTENIPGYKGHLPAKMFEYLFTGNFIIGTGDSDSEAAEILSETGHGMISNDLNKISGKIKELFELWEKKEYPVLSLEQTEKYTRKNLSARLAEYLDDIAAESRG